MGEITIGKNYNLVNAGDLDKDIVSIDMTLEDFFVMLNNFQYKELSEYIFGCPYDWTKDLIDEIQKPCDEPSHVHTIQLSYGIEVDKYIGDETHSVCTCWHVSGLGRPDKDAIENGCNPDKDISWAIEFTPVNKLKHARISLNDMAFVCKTEQTAKKEYDRSDIQTQRPSITLRELIHNILWELTFCGSTTERDEMWGQMQKDVEDIKAGKADLTSFESLESTMDGIINEIDEEDDDGIQD